MNNQDLRKVLLKVVDRLSDDFRKRLHFLLAGHVTRPIQDNTTTHGTLDLFQLLSDQDKIKENDVTLLINTFTDIGCMDAVKSLQEYMQSLRSTGVVIEPIETPVVQPSPVVQLSSKAITLIGDQEDDKVTVNTNYPKIISDQKDSRTENGIHVNGKYMTPGAYVKRKPRFGENVESPKKKKCQLLCISISMVLLTIIAIESIWITSLCAKYHGRNTQSLENRNLIARLNRSLLEKEGEMKNLNTNVSLWLHGEGSKCCSGKGKYCDKWVMNSYGKCGCG